MLDRWRSEHGQLPLFRTDGAGRRHMLLTRQHVQVMVNRRGATPFGQRNFLNTLRALFKWAMQEGRIPDDPTIGVTRLKASTSGYRTWGDEEIARFERRFPIGTKERLAFGLLLFTGQRRSDVVRMGPHMVRVGDDGPELVITQEKTRNPIAIPCIRSCARSSTPRPRSASRRFSLPIMASRTRLGVSAAGSAPSPTRRAVPAFRRTACAKRRRRCSPSLAAATSRSQRRSGSDRSQWSASTPARPIRDG